MLSLTASTAGTLLLHVIPGCVFLKLSGDGSKYSSSRLATPLLSFAGSDNGSFMDDVLDDVLSFGEGAGGSLSGHDIMQPLVRPAGRKRCVPSRIGAYIMVVGGIFLMIRGLRG